MTAQFSGRVTPVMRRVIAALDREGDMDANDLAEAACTSRNTLCSGGYLRKMLELELIRISRWMRNAPGAPTPVYSVSPGESVKPPKAYPPSVRSKRWRQKVGYRSEEYARGEALKKLARITAAT